jgi:predicted DsbA family dithiol-disulfide isomerase
MLETDRCLAEVRADEAEARALGIQGVPFFVLDRRYGVSGAQPADVLLQVLERAWTESRPLTVVGGGDTGQTCTDDNCAV